MRASDYVEARCKHVGRSVVYTQRAQQQQRQQATRKQRSTHTHNASNALRYAAQRGVCLTERVACKVNSVYDVCMCMCACVRRSVPAHVCNEGSCCTLTHSQLRQHARAHTHRTHTNTVCACGQSCIHCLCRVCVYTPLPSPPSYRCRTPRTTHTQHMHTIADATATNARRQRIAQPQRRRAQRSRL